MGPQVTDFEINLGRASTGNSALRHTFDTVMAAIPDPVFQCNLSLRLTYANPAYLRLVGRSWHEVIGLPLSELHLSGIAAHEMQVRLRHALKYGEALKWESSLETSTGRRHFELTFAPAPGDDGHVQSVVAYMRDITDRFHLTALARTDLEHLRKERELRETFVAALADDLRTPIAAALTIADHLLDLPDEFSSVHGHWLKRIVASLARADRMIENLLNVTQVRAGKRLPLNIEKIELEALVNGVLASLSLRHPGRFSLESEGPSHGLWCAEGLRRVFENLALNAVKYGDPDAPISFQMRQTDSGVRIAIHNHGSPILPEIQEHLFTPFHQIYSVGPNKHRGWGLGLTLARGITESHGGQIRVYSEPDRGTTFIIDLPRDSRPFQSA
jgi:PAS domain S-box-containing protein